MSRRRISSARRQSRLRRSSNEGSGELEEDSNVFDADDPLWFKRMEGNNTVLRPSLQLSNSEETPADLDSASCDEMPPPQDGWWDPLNKLNQSINQSPKVRRTIGSNVNTEAAAENTTLHEESVDSLPEKDPRKRKTRLFLGSQRRQSVGSNAFLNVLNDSATTVISDPGPSKKRKLLTKTSYLSAEDSFLRTENQRRSRNYQPDEETSKFSPLRSRKSRPALFNKIRSSQSQSTTNVFDNILENASSNSEVSIPTRDIALSQNAGLTNSQERRSKDYEQSFNSEQNLSQNLSKKHRANKSISKSADISISSNLSPKFLSTEERKRDLTLESNSSDVEMKKMKPGFFRRTRKSMEKNAFDSVFTSDGESTHEIAKLNKSQDRNSSIKSVGKDREQKQNKTNLNKSENSRPIPIDESNNLGGKLEERKDISDSDSDIDVEGKNDGSTKSSREGSPQSSSRNRVSQQSSQIGNASQSSKSVPVASVNHSQYASKILNSEEEEDVISVGSQGIVDQINRQKSFSSSKKHNSSFNKSKGTSQNFDNEKQSSRLSDSIKIPERMSIFAEEPQYESTRKIDIPKSTNSQQSRRVSTLNTSSDGSKELTARKSTTENKSTYNLPKDEFSRRKTLDDEETSDVEIADPKTAISTLQNKRESRHSKSRSSNNVSKNEKNFRDVANSKNESSEKEGSVNSERSHTISLTEDESTSKSNNPSPKTNSSKRFKHSFIPSGDSNDEENLEENNLAPKQISKPTIRGYEILKPNDIDIKKLKGSNKVVSAKNNTSRISRPPPAIQSFSASQKSSSILAKDPKISLIEHELRQLHGEEYSGIASVSRNLFHKDVDDEVFEETSYNKSLRDLRKNLEDVDDSDSEVSENPLLTYTGNVSEEEVDESEHEDTGPQKDLERKSSPLVKEDARALKQKMIDDYFKRRNEKRTDGSQGFSVAEAFKDKNLMAQIKKQVEAIVAPIKKELFEKPKNLEPPKKKLASTKVTTKNSQKKDSKPVNTSYLVNGVVYKPPKLPRPKRWATNLLYKFIWKKIEPKYKTRTRVRSEKFVLRLAEVYDRVTKLKYKNYVDDLESLMREMAKMGLIVTRKDFNDFCIEFMPYSFREKATPILLPGNKMSIPYDPDTFYTPILTDDSR